MSENQAQSSSKFAAEFEAMKESNFYKEPK